MSGDAGFEITERKVNTQAGQEALARHEERKNIVVQGLQLGVNELPLGQTLISGIFPYKQNFPNSCFIAGVVASSGKDKRTFLEKTIRYELTQAKLISEEGVFTAREGDLQQVNRILENRLGVTVRRLVEGDETVGQSVIRVAIKNNNPSLICYEVDSSTRAAHWVLLGGVERVSDARTNFLLMDPVQGELRTVTDRRLADMIIGSYGYAPQLMVVERPFEILHRTD